MIRPLRYCMPICCLLLAVTLRAAFAADALSPEQELETFEVAPGYEVSLFASEKDGIANPIQMRWGPDGKLYVISTPLYPQIKPGEKANDKIVVLSDSDGDGKADGRQTFAENLFLPQGIELGDGGVYVGSGPDLLHLRDTDGDGKADTRRLVLTGFGIGDTHQLINNFTWSPGGDLFFSQGLHIFSRIETPWGIERLDNAGLWRLRPRRLQLDPFFGREAPPHNPWGLAFDDWGQPILAAGNGHGIFWMTPALIRHSHRQPLPTLWNRDKVASTEFLGGEHFGSETANQIVTGSFLNNTILRFRLEDDSQNMKLEEMAPLIVSKHRSFRPVDMRIGPDGALYVADWYNPIIGHYQASYRHPDRDKEHGRIWRVSAKDRPLRTPSDLTGLKIPELVEKLRSDERYERHQVRRLLQAGDSEKVVSAVLAWVDKMDEKDPAYEQLLYRAIGVLQSHEYVDEQLLSKLVAARDPRARAYAARVVGLWQDRLRDPLSTLATLVRDENERVRLEAVVACSYVPDARAMEVAARAVDAPRNKYIDYALVHAVHALGPHWRDAFVAGSIDFGKDPERIAFVLSADGSAEMLAFLQNPKLVGRLSPKIREQMLRRLALAGGPKELAYVLRHEDLSAALLESVATAALLRGVRPEGDWIAPMRRWLGSDDSAMRAAAIDLAASWKMEELSAEVLQFATDLSEATEVRCAAAKALLPLGAASATETLNALSENPKNWQLACAALGSWAQTDIAAAAKRATELIESITTEQQASDLLAAILVRKEGAAALADALSGATIPSAAAGQLRRAASAAAVSHERLTEVLDSALGLKSVQRAHDPVWINALALEVLENGNAERGKEVFQSAYLNCAACHAIYGKGEKVGPDLSSVGRGMPVDRIIEAVVWPAREIKEGYVSITIFTHDGKVFQGIKVSESPDGIVLLDAVTKKEEMIPWRTVDRFEAAGTLMPSGLTSGLPRADLRDLVRYLSELDGSLLRPGQSDPKAPSGAAKAP